MRRVWAAFGVLLLGALVLTRNSPPPVPSAPSLQGVPKAHPSPMASGDIPKNLRDPFRYVVEKSVAVRAPVTSAAPPTPTSLPAPVSLVGFLRDGKGLAAVLSIRGEIVLLRSGDAFQGYRVSSLDADGGVTVVDPQGQEIRLASS